jgi:WD40 repeat protein
MHLKDENAKYYSSNDDAVESLLWVDKESKLFSGHRSGTIRVWDSTKAKPLSETKLTTQWIRVLAKPDHLEMIIAGTDEVMTIPTCNNDLEALQLSERDTMATCIAPKDNKVITTLGEGILFYSFDNKGLDGVVPFGNIFHDMQASKNIDPWNREEGIFTTAICSALQGQVVFIGCNNGAVFGIDLPTKQIVLAILSTSSPITSICCNRKGSNVTFASGRSIFGLSIGPESQIEHSTRVRINHELKAFPLMTFIDDDTVLIDTGISTDCISASENRVLHDHSNLEIRRFPDLAKICAIHVPTTLSLATYLNRKAVLIAVEGNIRFAQNTFSKLTGKREFVSGQLTSTATRRYALWRIPIVSDGEDMRFTGEPKRFCTGHLSPPIGIASCEERDLIAVLSVDGNMSLWMSFGGFRLQEIQLKSKGLCGPVFINGNQFVCVDNGQGRQDGPEIYQFITT